MAIQYSDGEYIKLYRKLINWEWYQDINTKTLFLHLLLKANWKEGSWQGINYKRGQLIASINTLAAETGLTFEQVRTSIKHLKSTGEITYEKLPKGGLFTVVEYNRFQDVPTQKPQKTHTETQTETTETTHESQQYKNNKEYKEDKKESEEPALTPIKPHRFPCGKYQNVFLSQEESAKLSSEFGLVETQRVIERLSEHMATKKNNYKDDGHYALICKWIREDKEKPKQEIQTQKKSQVGIKIHETQYSDEDYLAMERKKLGII